MKFSFKLNDSSAQLDRITWQSAHSCTILLSYNCVTVLRCDRQIDILYLLENLKEYQTQNLFLNSSLTDATWHKCMQYNLKVQDIAE
ncbi:hypothetical protein H6F50_23210 [Coleofasciculus sp. FACHB-712]|uniref:hypothetical protein n=1 Tax=Coleofasciculus sp. FACHB-712 TaxID=2692789 RepID=UPI0016875AD0|nr:hypothetical protein [Coleofasciculus sp. FACHB-712]MBD1945223.1 hypothetical protein [Coleofasciculus sp. FACHB-712]